MPNKNLMFCAISCLICGSLSTRTCRFFVVCSTVTGKEDTIKAVHVIIVYCVTVNVANSANYDID